MTRDEVAKYIIPHARKAAKRCAYRYGLDADDVEGSILQRVADAMSKNDVEDMEAAKTYFYRTIPAGIGDALRYHRRHQNYLDIDDYEIQAEEMKSDPMFLMRMSVHLKGLTKQRMDIIMSVYFGDETLSEYAERTGKSRQSVTMGHKLAIERIRENMGVEV